MDENHFEGDDEGYSMVVEGETDSSLSKGTFDDNEYDYVEEIAEMCPVEVISVEKINK